MLKAAAADAVLKAAAAGGAATAACGSSADAFGADIAAGTGCSNQQPGRVQLAPSLQGPLPAKAGDSALVADTPEIVSPELDDPIEARVHVDTRPSLVIQEMQRGREAFLASV